eukprot:144864-Chlamydomonas_euryale.AAC.1
MTPGLSAAAAAATAAEGREAGRVGTKGLCRWCVPYNPGGRWASLATSTWRLRLPWQHSCHRDALEVPTATRASPARSCQ